MAATLADIQRKYGESVYPLYKDEIHAPYMENDNEKGYKGVVLYDELEDKVQCSICGEWFKQITGGHLKTHQVESVEDYKRDNGLSLSTPLCSKNYSKTRSEISKKGLGRVNKSRKSTGNYPKRMFTNKSQAESKKQMVITKNLIGYKNKFGLCDAQIASRLIIVAQMSNKKVGEINNKDVTRHDHKLLHTLTARYGNTEEACKKLNINYIGKKYYTDVEILGQLRKWVKENGKLIKTTDANHAWLGNWYIPKHLFRNYNGLPTSSTIRKYFGSWTRAKMMAGLDQLLQEVRDGKSRL